MNRRKERPTGKRAPRESRNRLLETKKRKHRPSSHTRPPTTPKPRARPGLFLEYYPTFGRHSQSIRGIASPPLASEPQAGFPYRQPPSQFALSKSHVLVRSASASNPTPSRYQHWSGHNERRPCRRSAGRTEQDGSQIRTEARPQTGGEFKHGHGITSRNTDGVAGSPPPEQRQKTP